MGRAVYLKWTGGVSTNGRLITMQPDTEAALREVMIAAAVTPPKTIVARTQQIY